jgi:phosphoglucosamine mutase
MVDDEGVVWDGDKIVSMLAVWLKEEGRLKNDVIVMTEYSNLSAVLFLEKNGIKVEKVLNGDRAVAHKCKEIGAIIGGEVAGHIIYPEWTSASDGLFAAVMVANIVNSKGTKLSSLRATYKNFPSKLWNIRVKERKPLEEIKGWSDELKKQQEYLGTTGRTFARYSGTEDLLRILVEAKDVVKMEEVGEALSKIIKKEIGE